MKQKRKRQVASANSRHTERRQAAKLLNELLVQVGADALRLNTDGAPCVDVLAKVLRVLDRRCSGETVRPVFEAAVRKYVSNGGLLPEGVCLHPERGLELAVDSAAEAPLVSKHKLLLRSFAFKSKVRHHRNLRIQDVFHTYSTVFGLHHSVFSFLGSARTVCFPHFASLIS